MPTSFTTQSQTRPVWDCQDGLPQTDPPGTTPGLIGIYGSPMGRVWELFSGSMLIVQSVDLHQFLSFWTCHQLDPTLQDQAKLKKCGTAPWRPWN